MLGEFAGSCLGPIFAPDTINSIADSNRLLRRYVFAPYPESVDDASSDDDEDMNTVAGGDASTRTTRTTTRTGPRGMGASHGDERRKEYDGFLDYGSPPPRKRGKLHYSRAGGDANDEFPLSDSE